MPEGLKESATYTRNLVSGSYLYCPTLSCMDAIDQAAALIREGKLVAFPTETVYGLGADALDPLAVARIFEAKERPSFDPLIVHIARLEQLHELTLSRDPRIGLLADAFWPGPLTLVLPKQARVPDLVTSGLPTVGIRMPDHPIARELILRSGRPIAAPSANKFGHLSPTRAEHVIRNLPEADLVLDGGATQVGIESTIVALADDGFQILRPGVITREDLMKILPESAQAPGSGAVQAPGMLASHYSPRKPLYLVEPGQTPGIDTSVCGYIGFRRPPAQPYQEVMLLAPEGDLREYAAGIFGALHHMEASAVEAIVAETVPEQGLGVAIMDRLRKAAYDYTR